VIEKSLLYYLLERKDEMLLTRLDEDKFLDSKIKSYITRIKEYKEKHNLIPSTDEFQTLVNNHTLFEDTKLIGPGLIPFYLDQIDERNSKYNFFNSMYDIINTKNDYEFNEIVDKVQELLLTTNTENDKIEDIDCSEVFSEEDVLIRSPLGLGKFDKVNGGLASSELALLGGHRGQGKSILALNTALNRFRMGKTVGFISIEMRASEVKFRLDAMVTGLPVKDIQRDRLTRDQLITYFTRKARLFCDDTVEFINMINRDPDINKSKMMKAYSQLPRKENKFFLYDLPTCNLTDINYITTKLRKIHKLNYLVVDYLNIIKVPSATDSIDWKVQLQRSEGLKTIARKNDIALLAPIQISEEGVVKFSKAIEDPVDVSIFFKKTKNNSTSDSLTLYTSKIRNGTECSFNLLFDRSCLRVREFEEKDEQ
jgi:replicative DNA helicase